MFSFLPRNKGAVMVQACVCLPQQTTRAARLQASERPPAQGVLHTRKKGMNLLPRRQCVRAAT